MLDNASRGLCVGLFIYYDTQTVYYVPAGTVITCHHSPHYFYLRYKSASVISSGVYVRCYLLDLLPATGYVSTYLLYYLLYLHIYCIIYCIYSNIYCVTFQIAALYMHD